MDEQRVQVTIHTIDGKTYSGLVYLRPMFDGLGFFHRGVDWQCLELIGGGCAIIRTDNIAAVTMVSDVQVIHDALADAL